MRLVRLGPAGSETPGVLVDDDVFVEVFLRGGETMTLGISRLGRQAQHVIAHPAAVV
ncbi:hypothetical protein [Microbacterium deminutum]|uniref:Uncharacterized protein n=1 Tax=Microbacterium deminutum TaxID=344164 RepID=A0ABP5BXM6_9MICO